jgi:hypothetical protein
MDESPSSEADIPQSRNSTRFMELEGSCSQKPATCPYSEPDGSNPQTSTLFFQDPFLYYPPIYV